MNALIKSSDLAKIGVLAAFGRYRRFGLHGPVYEVLEDQARASDRGPVVRVRVVESGEEFDYRLESLIGDPQER
jgi:hypothetical protein